MYHIQQHIIKALAYFDLFQYPLTKEEIRLFMQSVENQERVDEQLEFLTEAGVVYRVDEFYSLQNNLALAARRRNGNDKAAAELKNAVKAARILARFPFVKGLALSGSLSKNFADENTDIDFFIITKANRLWIARTLMHVFYKLTRIIGRQRWFCMNYYVDETALEIEEKNVFTAVEIVTLVPMRGHDEFARFLACNRWVKNYFPAFRQRTGESTIVSKRMLSSFLEKMFAGKLGEMTDNWLMKLTSRRWQRKEDRLNVNAKGVCMGMLAGKHFAKPDPKNFQLNILGRYESRTLQALDRLKPEPLLVK